MRRPVPEFPVMPLCRAALRTSPVTRRSGLRLRPFRPHLLEFVKLLTGQYFLEIGLVLFGHFLHCFPVGLYCFLLLIVLPREQCGEVFRLLVVQGESFFQETYPFFYPFRFGQFPVLVLRPLAAGSLGKREAESYGSRDNC